MAKVLFFNLPAHGHVNATLPVVAELVRRDHEVVYICGDEFQAAIEKSGARFRSYPDEMKDLNAEIASAVVKNMVNVSPLLLRAAAIVTPFALAEIEREKPDLLMHDSITFWGRLAAYVSGIPSVVTYSNFALEGIKLELNWRVMAQFVLSALPRLPAIARSRHRLSQMYGADAVKAPLFPTRGTKNIVFMAREFHPQTAFVDESFVFVGPSIDPEMRAETTWESIKTDQPLVYVSLGTINNQNMSFYRTVFEAFAHTPAQILVSIGRGTSAEQFSKIPSNITLKNSVPQLQVLQQTDVFITHGGMNSVQEGFYYGVPEIVVPQQIEQLINGVQVARVGAGILLGNKIPLGQVTASALGEALDTVLRDSCYKDAAQRMSRAARADGGYHRAADEVEMLL